MIPNHPYWMIKLEFVEREHITYSAMRLDFESEDLLASSAPRTPTTVMQTFQSFSGHTSLVKHIQIVRSGRPLERHLQRPPFLSPLKLGGSSLLSTVD